jgi:hypothetical protein
MDSQKAANWSQIIGTVFAAILLGYAVWDHLPNGNQSGSSVAWGDTMKGYIAPAIIALILFASAILQAIASRRRHPQPKLVGTGESESEAMERIGNQHDQLQGELHLAENEVATLKGEKGTLSREKEKLTKDLANEKKQHESLKRSMEISRREVAEARADAKAQQETYQLERTGILIERNMLADQVKELQEAIGLANQKLANEEIQTGNWIQSCTKAERELSDLRWLEGRMKQQGEQLDNWVRITHVKCIKLQLTQTPRMIVLALWVHNGSIFDVTFDFDHVKGCLHFKNRPLHDPIRVPPSKVLDIVHPGGGIEIVVEQPLLATEAETVFTAQKGGDPNGILWLGNLTIPILTIHNPQSFNNHKLRIHAEIELQNITDFPCDK